MVSLGSPGITGKNKVPAGIFQLVPSFQQLLPGESKGTIFFEDWLQEKKLPLEIRAIK
jgi:hypothetical protein